MRIEQARSAGNGVFTHHLAREHIRQRIGCEQKLLCSGKRRVAGKLHCIKLKDAVEIDNLGARDAIKLAARHHVAHIQFHRLKCVRVAIAQRLAHRPIGCHAHKIHAPSVDAYTAYCQALCNSFFQAAHYLVVQRINIPIEMSVHLNKVVGKTCEFAHHKFAVLKFSHDGATAGGT